MTARYCSRRHKHSVAAIGQSWDWDGVHFEFLHPPQDSYTVEKLVNNELGCVLYISIGQHSILLTADIEKNSERRLLDHYSDNSLHPAGGAAPRQQDLLSPAFVAAVHPRYAVFTSGYRNRFGHPKAEVVERYRAIGSELLRSDEDGAILVQMDASTLQVEKYRKTHERYWQRSDDEKISEFRNKRLFLPLIQAHPRRQPHKITSNYCEIFYFIHKSQMGKILWKS